VTRKFSLKDNPIFQRLEPPQPRPVDPPIEEALPAEQGPSRQNLEQSSSEPHNLTLKSRPSSFTPQEPTQTDGSNERTEPPLQSVQGRQPSSPALPPRELVLHDHLDKSLFFSFYNEVADELLPMLAPAEQVLYSRLFRLSYGFNRNYCTVSQPLLIERTGLSRNTVRTALQSLLENGWVRIVEAGKRVSTTYRIILPREQMGIKASRVSINDPHKKTLKNRPSSAEGQKLSVSIGGSESVPPGAQNSGVQTLPLTIEEDKTINDEFNFHQRPTKIEGQNLPPVLKSFTNSSLTPIERGFDAQEITLKSQILWARELVDKFYSGLGQRPSRAKREKSIQECLDLLREGFTIEEMDYAISWLITQHPSTGSFSRLTHFIDQALKDRSAQQHAEDLDRHRVQEAERRELEQQRMEVEHQQIEAVKTALPSEHLMELHEEARQLVAQEQPNLRLGHDILIRLKVDEMIRARYIHEA
jgi:Helix-turn-helix domain